MAQAATTSKEGLIRSLGLDVLPPDLPDEIVAGKLKAAFRRLAGSKDRVVVSLPRSQVTLRHLHLPTQDPEEIAGMVELQAPSQLPYSKDEIVFDHKVVRFMPDGSSEVLLALAHAGSVKRLLRLFALAGAGVPEVSVSSYGVLNAWRALSRRANDRGYQMDLKSALCLVHLDASGAEFVIVDEGRLAFSRSVPELGEGQHDKIQDSVVEETLWTLKAYQNHRPGQNIERLVLLGVHPQLVPLGNYLQGRVKKNVQVLELGREWNWRLSDISPLIALGCALGPDGMSFLPKQDKLALKKRYRSQWVKSLSALVVLLALLLLGGAGSEIWWRAQCLAELQSQLVAEQPVDEERSQVRLDLERYVSLGRNEGSVLEVLRTLASCSPQSIHLSRFAFKKGDQVVIKGTSSHMSVLFGFVTDLETSGAFEQVDIRFASKRKLRSGTEIADFELECKLHSGEEDSVL